MASSLHCDNKDCCFYDAIRDCCDVDKLVGVRCGAVETGDREIDRLKAENERLHELVAEMFGEHTRIYHANGLLMAGFSATSKQMAHWYDECTHLGIEVSQ